MAEIEITLPTVQYGNVKIRGTAEEWGLDTIADAADVGVWAAVYLNLFQQGFKVGSQMDVSASVRAPLAAGVEEAVKLLDEGLGGVSELNQHPDDGPEEQDKAPWNSTVDAKPKPWETEGKKPVVTEDW